MSKKIGIPPTTFNRLLNGYSHPNITTLSKLIQNIPALKKCLPEEIRKAFQVNFEEAEGDYLPTGNRVEQDLSIVQKNKYIYEKDLVTLLSDKYMFLCYVLALSQKRITFKDIQYHFGQKGLKALDFLTQKNILLHNKEENFWIVNKKCPEFALPFHLVQKHLIFLAKQYDPEDVHHNYIHEVIEGLNEEGVDTLLKAHREFHKKVMKIMTNKNYKGDKPFFSMACSDFLVKV